MIAAIGEASRFMLSLLASLGPLLAIPFLRLPFPIAGLNVDVIQDMLTPIVPFIQIEKATVHKMRLNVLARRRRFPRPLLALPRCLILFVLLRSHSPR